MELPATHAHIAAVEQRQHQRVLHQRAEGQLAVVAVDADHPHQIGNHPHRRFRAEHLGMQGQFQRAGGLRIHRTRRLPAQRAHCVDRHLGIGERVAHGLVLDDRDCAAAAFGPGEVQGEIERRAHQSDGKDADDRRGAGEAALGEVLAASQRPDHIARRGAHLVEPEYRQQMRPIPRAAVTALQQTRVRRMRGVRARNTITDI